MANGICKYMDGAQCAENYCDFYDAEEQTCLPALEVRKRVEILNKMLATMEEKENKKQDIDEAKKLARDFNFVSGPDTRQ